MQFSAMFIFVALATFVYAAPKPGDTYTTKYDNIDIDEVIANDRIFNNYMDCIQEKTTCTAAGAELKSHMKDAIQTCCAKCSGKQKEGVEKVFTHMEKNKADKLNELTLQFDPTGEYEVECRKQLYA